MNCLKDLTKGFYRAYGTKYRSCHFHIKDVYFWSFFSACAQQGSMLTLASSSRVPFPTSTNVQWSIGIFFCPSWGLVLTFFFRLAPRSIKKQGLEQVLGAPFWACWNGNFFLFLLFFPGIPEFQFRENSRSRILRVMETIDRLIRRSLDSSIA